MLFYLFSIILFKIRKNIARDIGVPVLPISELDREAKIPFDVSTLLCMHSLFRIGFFTF